MIDGPAYYRSRVALALGVAALCAVGCDADLPGKPNIKDRPILPQDVLSFDVLYSRNCAGCHGADGKMGPAPPLNDALFRAIVKEDDLFDVLAKGRPHTAMAPFAQKQGGPLTALQTEVVVKQILGFSYEVEKNPATKELQLRTVTQGKRTSLTWGDVVPAPAGCPPYALPEKPGDAERGKQIFARACASCHGKVGEGTSSDGKVRNKINDPTFLALISDQAIRRIIITGRPDLGMPNYAEKKERPEDFKPLTSAQIADLGALLSSWRAAKPK